MVLHILHDKCIVSYVDDTMFYIPTTNRMMIFNTKTVLNPYTHDIYNNQIIRVVNIIIFPKFCNKSTLLNIGV